MKKIVVLLVLVLCISLASCSFSDFTAGSNNGGGGDGSFINPPAPKIYTVSFDSQGGSGVSNMRTDVLDEAPFTARENHLFCGWYRDANLTVPVVYPLSVEADMTLYAKWLRTSDVMSCRSTSIKYMDSNFDDSVLYSVNPPRFDLATLAAQGYHIKIEVSYDVFYQKDYDVLWDIGYAGSPKYEVYIRNSDYIGVSQEDMPTTTSSRTRTISYSASAASLMNTNLYLNFSTNNIQNIIYFRNIEVTYTCYK